MVFAAGSGNLAELKRLIAKFSFTEEDIESNNHFILDAALYGGHIHVLEWLDETFNLSDMSIYYDLYEFTRLLIT